jgi:hypothetical protein
MIFFGRGTTQNRIGEDMKLSSILLGSILQRFISVTFLVALCCGYAHAQRLVVVGWNIKSGGATDAAVAHRFRRFQGADIWGLSEVATTHP